MKDKIQNSKFVKWIAELKISKYLSEHQFFGRFFNYEFISYLIVGVLTTVVSYVVYALCIEWTSTILANTISFIAAVLFAYFANKIFVFDSPSFKKEVVVPEFLKFIASRIFSYVLETAFLWLTVDVLHAPSFLMKVVASVFVVIINYITGKFLVFIRKGGSEQ